MPRIEKIHEVGHRAADMFELVGDVENYPKFVPLCQSLVVRSCREKNGKKLLISDMTMAYKMLSETFTTQVLMDAETLSIDVKYLEGPFSHLDNQWRFEALGEKHCRVQFMVDYELKSKMLAMAAGTVFELAFGKFVSAFENRANEVYGQST